MVRLISPFVVDRIAQSPILGPCCLKVAFYALVMGLAGLIFFYIGVSMGWLYVRIPDLSMYCFDMPS